MKQKISFWTIVLTLSIITFSACKKDDPKDVTTNFSGKPITSFKFTALNPVAEGVIDTIAKTIVVNVPTGTDVTALKPEIVLLTGYSISPLSGTTQNFTLPVIYAVKQSDGSIVNWTVVVTVSGPIIVSSIDTISTDVDVNTTWHANKIYVVIGTISINAALTIEPGTILKFTDGSGLNVNTSGSVKAEGTALFPINFTSVKNDVIGGDTNHDGLNSTPGNKDWSGIYDYGNNSSYKYCSFTYGGASNYTLIIRKTAVIDHCMFVNNNGGEMGATIYGALALYDATSQTTVTNSTFYGNNIPMSINSDISIDDSNTFQDVTGLLKNKYNAIFDYNNNSTSVTWGETEVPFVIAEHITINATFNIKEGVLLKFMSDNNISVLGNGTIKALGTALKPIIFTSVKNDNFGGDTNADGAQSESGNKDWEGIYDEGKNSVYTNCKFSYGGGSSYTLEIVHKATVTDCWFINNDGGEIGGSIYGALSLYKTDPATIVTGNTFYGNTIPMTINCDLSIDNSNVFHDPSNAAITNKYNGIFAYYNNTIPTNWKETEVPFVISDGITIHSSLTLSSGMVVKITVDNTINISAGGTFNFTGSTLTSIKDDTLLGDTNGDGAASSPSTGDWTGLWSESADAYLSASNIKFAAN